MIHIKRCVLGRFLFLHLFTKYDTIHTFAFSANKSIKNNQPNKTKETKQKKQNKRNKTTKEIKKFRNAVAKHRGNEVAATTQRFQEL